MSDKLKELRDKIDALDDQILQLINQRAEHARSIARLKNDGVIYRAEREAQILRRLSEQNAGPLSKQAIESIFVEIMSVCRSLEGSVSVAFMGPHGTFSEEATLKRFGDHASTVLCTSIDEVFRKIEGEAVGYGVVPIENSTEGAVGRTLDLLLQTPLKICGEVILPVHQCFMTKAETIADIQKIYSHAQSLAQCHEWLYQHHPQIKRVVAISNAEAARLASQDTSAAAVASKTAAKIYGLNILAENIEDDPNNTTRFVVLATHDVAPSGKDKTSLIMSTRNRPGAIHDLLKPFAQNKVSLTKLESRPSRTGLWEYIFYVDIEGHQDDSHVAAALQEVREHAAFLKILGSYPAALS